VEHPNAPMRSNLSKNPLSICRNFGGFKGIYEQVFNERAIRFRTCSNGYRTP
jgi:hypothetical protein